jgi:hypothetical protein
VVEIMVKVPIEEDLVTTKKQDEKELQRLANQF